MMSRLRGERGTLVTKRTLIAREPRGQSQTESWPSENLPVAPEKWCALALLDFALALLHKYRP